MEKTSNLKDRGINQTRKTMQDMDSLALNLSSVLKKYISGSALPPVARAEELQSKLLPQDHFTVMYPPDGGKKKVDSGVVEIDFWEGTVRIANVLASSNLTKSLQRTGKPAIFVLLVRVSRTCKIRMDESGERTISGDFKSKGIPIKRIALYSVDGGSFECSIIASTNSKADFDDESESFPSELGSIHNTQISADTNLFSADISPKNPPTVLKTQCAFNHSGAFNAIVKKNGVSQTVNLRVSGTYTPLGTVLNEFRILAGVGDSFNFQYGVAGTCMVFRVHEDSGA